MISKTARRLINPNFAALLVMVTMSGCGGAGGCAQLGSLAKPYPADQVVEGGVQTRITPAGFNKLKDVLRALINDQLSAGMCIPQQNTTVLGAPVMACYQRSCAASAVGCRVPFNVDSISMTVPSSSALRIDAQFDVGTASNPIYVPVSADIPVIGTENCTFSAYLNNAHINFDVGFSIDAATGELRVAATNINQTDITGISISGCGVLGDILGGVVSFAANVLNTRFGNWVANLLKPQINAAIQGFLPNPLGVEGTVDLGSLFSSISPGTRGKLETRVVPGGYVGLRNNGLSLGVNVLLNSDWDPATRAAATDSEPAECIPGRPAPTLSAAPWNLTRTSRQTYKLNEATQFSGAADPTTDFAIGISETVLDLAGHHIFSSGGMCLNLGTRTVSQLNVGTLGILIPSLLKTANRNGKAPLLLELRPMFPLDFKIGTGTTADPHLTVGVKEMEIDFYAWANERYARAFTMIVDMSIGLNLNFVRDAMGKPALEPMLVGLDPATVRIRVQNSELLEEDPATLEMVLPDLLNVVIPVIGNSLKPFAVPSISGFSLSDLRVTKVVTSEDDFLAIYASLGAASASNPSTLGGGENLPSILPVTSAPLPSADTTATARVVMPNGYAGVKRAMLSRNAADRARVVLSLGGVSPNSQPLEWQVKIDNGFWQPYVSTSELVLTDTAFQIEGHHSIEVRARVPGHWESYDETPVVLDVVIDGQAPNLPERAVIRTDRVEFAAWDMAAKDSELTYSIANTDGSWTNLGNTPSIPLDAVSSHLRAGEKTLRVKVADASGHEAESSVALPTAAIKQAISTKSRTAAGCSTAPATKQSKQTVWLVSAVSLLLLALGLRRHKQKRALNFGKASPLLIGIGFVATASMLPGCGCSSSESGDPPVQPMVGCSVSTECGGYSCGMGQLAVCRDMSCTCQDDVWMGEAGRYSDIVVKPNGPTIVSAYNTTYGDLVVGSITGVGKVTDWKFIDGVPTVPEEERLPESAIRNGVFENGDDVGAYNDIEMTAAGAGRISYYDKTNGALKFASETAGVWTNHTVDDGTGTDATGGEDMGRWSSLTLAADGTPGIAYVAISADGGARRTQVRFAKAKVPNPTQRSDWDLVLISEAAIVPPAPMAPAPVIDYDDAVGQMIATARKPSGDPVVAYYDRTAGDLKYATWNPAQSRFTVPASIDDQLVGGDAGDMGAYPSIYIPADGIAHFTFMDVARHRLVYANLDAKRLEEVDDGLRIDGMTSDGLDKPVVHHVGSDSSLLLIGGKLFAVYMDATNHELLISERMSANLWRRKVIAGNEMPFAGTYGWSAAATPGTTNAVLSSYVIDSKTLETYVKVFGENLVIE